MVLEDWVAKFAATPVGVWVDELIISCTPWLYFGFLLGLSYAIILFMDGYRPRWLWLCVAVVLSALAMRHLMIVQMCGAPAWLALLVVLIVTVVILLLHCTWNYFARLNNRVKACEAEIKKLTTGDKKGEEKS